MGSVQTVQSDIALRKPSDAAELFRRSCTEQRLQGIEWERVLIDSATGQPVPYFRQLGQGAAMVDVFDRLLKSKNGWQPIREAPGCPVIGIERVRIGGSWDNMADREQIVLEPGNQLEIVSAAWPFIQLPQAAAALTAINNELVKVCDRLGLLLGTTGWTPTPIDRTNLLRNPKSRYPSMYNVMSQDDKEAASDTASVQFTHDYASEQDAIDKSRVMLGLMPLMTALTNNSPLRYGEFGGFQSERMERWNHYLNDRPEHKPRMGNMPWAFEKDFNFTSYAERVSRLPLMFVVEKGMYVPAQGETFADTIASGKAHLSDFKNFLTSTTYDIRFKGGLEARQMDSPADVGTVMALAVVWNMAMYDRTVRNELLHEVTSWSQSTRDALRQDVPRTGLETVIQDGSNRTLRDFGKDVLLLVERAVDHQYATQESAAYVTMRNFFAPLQTVLYGETPGEKLARQLGLSTPSGQFGRVSKPRAEIMQACWGDVCNKPSFQGRALACN